MKLKLTLFVIVIILMISLGLIFTRKNKSKHFPVFPTTSVTPFIDEHQDWKTFSDVENKVSFKYPENLETKYIRTQEWPPILSISTEEFKCEEGGNTEGQPLVIRKTIKGLEFCISNLTEAAAGTAYSNYSYAFLKQNKLIKISFIIAYPQCGNYEDAERSECEAERQSFDLDALIGEIAGTVNFSN